MNNFQIIALQESGFAGLFEMTDQELGKTGILRMTVDRKPGFPCRISLRDAEPGEEVLLLHYQHHDVHSPYRAGGPIYIRKEAITARLAVNEIPTMLEHRLLSLRAYDATGMMKAARVTEGRDLRLAIEELFSEPAVRYIHIHNAKPGCYNCRVERA